MKIQLLLAGFFCSTVALAGELFVPLGVSDSRVGDVMVFLDASSIKRSNVKVVDDMTGVQYYSADIFAKPSAGEVRVNYIIACKDRAYYQNAYIMYDAERQTIDSHQSRESLSTHDFNRVFSDGLAGRLVDVVCNTVKLGLHKN